MTNEEQNLYNKLVQLKNENEYLISIFKEVDSLICSGYDGSFAGEQAQDILYAVNEYKKWKKNAYST